MTKVTMRAATKYTEEGCRQEVVFADTQEPAGYMAGWSGDYLAVRLNGEKQRFSKLKDAKEYLASQEVPAAAPVMEMTLSSKPVPTKRMGYSQGKKLTAAQKRKYGIA